MSTEQQPAGGRIEIADGEEPDVMEIIAADRSKKQRFESNRKFVWKAYLLWLFLGWFGGHRFYLGYSASAIFMILMSLLALTLMLITHFGVFMLFPPGLWLLVDGFIIPAIVRNKNNRLIEQIMR